MVPTTIGLVFVQTNSEECEYVKSQMSHNVYYDICEQENSLDVVQTMIAPNDLAFTFGRLRNSKLSLVVPSRFGLM